MALYNMAAARYRRIKDKLETIKFPDIVDYQSAAIEAQYEIGNVKELLASIINSDALMDMESDIAEKMEKIQMHCAQINELTNSVYLYVRKMEDVVDRRIAMLSEE